MLDSNLKLLVNSYVDSLLSWDVIVFLYENKSHLSGIADLARSIGRKPKEVEKIISSLKRKGVIDGHHYSPGHKSLFALSNEFRQEIKPFISALGKRESRLAILTEVLKKEVGLS